MSPIRLRKLAKNIFQRKNLIILTLKVIYSRKLEEESIEPNTKWLNIHTLVYVESIS